LDGFSLMSQGWFAKFTKLSPHQMFLLYGICNHLITQLGNYVIKHYICFVRKPFWGILVAIFVQYPLLFAGYNFIKMLRYIQYKSMFIVWLLYHMQVFRTGWNWWFEKISYFVLDKIWSNQVIQGFKLITLCKVTHTVISDSRYYIGGLDDASLLQQWLMHNNHEQVATHISSDYANIF